jgi:hypothetical protein
MQNSRVTTDVGLYLKKSFVYLGTNRRGCRQPRLLPKLLLTLSLCLLLLSSRATKLCLATTLTWSDGMNGMCYKWGRGSLFIVERWSRGYSSSMSSICMIILLYPWLKPTSNHYKLTHRIAPNCAFLNVSEGEEVWVIWVVAQRPWTITRCPLGWTWLPLGSLVSVEALDQVWWPLDKGPCVLMPKGVARRPQCPNPVWPILAIFRKV